MLKMKRILHWQIVLRSLSVLPAAGEFELVDAIFEW